MGHNTNVTLMLMFAAVSPTTYHKPIYPEDEECMNEWGNVLREEIK